MTTMKICQQVRQNLEYLTTIDFHNVSNEAEMVKIGESMPFPMAFHSGCTQGAFVHEDFNAVIKFEIDSSERACHFSMVRYKIAQEMGVSAILLPVEFAGESKNGIELYIQPKFKVAHCDLEWSENRRYNRYNSNVNERLAYKIMRNCYDSRLSRAWVESAIRVYGKRFMKRFEEFTRRCEVNDLHQANVGYIGNRPVIIDYAGYCTGWEGE